MSKAIYNGPALIVEVWLNRVGVDRRAGIDIAQVLRQVAQHMDDQGGHGAHIYVMGSILGAVRVEDVRHPSLDGRAEDAPPEHQKQQEHEHGPSVRAPVERCVSLHRDGEHQPHEHGDPERKAECHSSPLGPTPMSDKPMKKFVVRVTRTSLQHRDVSIRASTREDAIEQAERRFRAGAIQGWSEPDVRDSDFEILSEEDPG